MRCKVRSMRDAVNDETPWEVKFLRRQETDYEGVRAPSHVRSNLGRMDREWESASVEQFVGVPDSGILRMPGYLHLSLCQLEQERLRTAPMRGRRDSLRLTAQTVTIRVKCLLHSL